MNELMEELKMTIGEGRAEAIFFRVLDEAFTSDISEVAEKYEVPTHFIKKMKEYAEPLLVKKPAYADRCIWAYLSTDFKDAGDGRRFGVVLEKQDSDEIEFDAFKTMNEAVKRVLTVNELAAKKWEDIPAA